MRGMGKRVKAFYLHENDWWSAYTWMAAVILASLNQYIEHDKCGFPVCFHDDGGAEKWAEELLKMQRAFTLLAGEADHPSRSEDQPIIDAGLASFAKYFQGIWD